MAVVGRLAGEGEEQLLSAEQEVRHNSGLMETSCKVGRQRWREHQRWDSLESALAEETRRPYARRSGRKAVAGRAQKVTQAVD